MVWDNIGLHQLADGLELVNGQLAKVLACLAPNFNQGLLGYSDAYMAELEKNGVI